MKAIQKSLLALALAGVFTNANATLVDWTFSNSNADFTGVNKVYPINGSFTYDADTSTFSNVNIVTNAGSSTYNAITQLDANSYNLLTPNGATWIIDFAINNPFTNAGGSLTFTGKSTIDFFNAPINLSGTLVGVPQPTTSAVPEPEVYAMMLAGLGLVGFAARRKSA